MYITLDDITIFYKQYGNKGKEILILPGWGNTQETFRNIINYFQDSHTIYILDYPGFGNSPLPNHDLTIYDYTKLIINFLKEKEIENPIIIAHSFGGRIATLLTAYYKLNISKMIFIDVAGIKPKKGLKKFFKEKLYKLLKKATYLLPKLKQEIFRQKLLKLFASADYYALSPSMHNTFKNIINEDLTPYYKNITSEVLLIWGEYDESTPLKDALKIRKSIKDSALIVLKKATHYSYLQYPLLTNKIIASFLQEKKD